MPSKKRTAIILCGGKGTRLGALGKKIPKSLVKIHNFPILWFIIKILKKNNFNHFILPVGFKGKKIQDYINKKKELKKINIEIVNTGENTSIAKRIFLIKDKISSQNFILVNGDAIFNFNLNKMFKNHLRKKFDMTFIGCEAKLNFGIVGFKTLIYCCVSLISVLEFPNLYQTNPAKHKIKIKNIIVIFSIQITPGGHLFAIYIYYTR